MLLCVTFMNMATEAIRAYKKKYDEFRSKYNMIQNSAELEKLFADFSTCYLLLPDFWSFKLRKEAELSRNVFTGVRILKQAMYDFYSEAVYDSANIRYKSGFQHLPFNRLLNGRDFKRFKEKCENLRGTKECEILLRDALSYPHSNLKTVLEFYHTFSGSFPCLVIRQLYEKSQRLYDKIMDNKYDAVKWFTILLESQDDRFIIQNVETRIAEEFTNNTLWILYINYLKSKNKKAAFEVWYRFRRLFLDDKTFDNDFKLWKNKPPQKCGNRYLEKMKYQAHDWKKKKIIVKYPPAPLYFKIQPLPPQNFIYPVQMINFIIKNSKAEILQKLYQCSKYFYLKVQKPLCHTLFVHNVCESNYYCNSLAINVQNVNLKGLSKFHVTNQITVSITNFPTWPKNRHLLSIIIPRLNSCDIKILQILKQNISNFDYQFLTEAGNIEKIVLEEVQIKYSNNANSYLTLEHFFVNLSKSTVIKTPVTVSITTASWNFLVNWKKLSKIDEMYFPFCTEINETEFLKFLFKNCNNNCQIFYFDASLCNSLNKAITNIRKKANQRNIDLLFPNIVLSVPHHFHNLFI